MNNNYKDVIYFEIVTTRIDNKKYIEIIRDSGEEELVLFTQQEYEKVLYEMKSIKNAKVVNQNGSEVLTVIYNDDKKEYFPPELFKYFEEIYKLKQMANEKVKVQNKEKPKKEKKAQIGKSKAILLTAGAVVGSMVVFSSIFNLVGTAIVLKRTNNNFLNKLMKNAETKGVMPSQSPLKEAEVQTVEPAPSKKTVEIIEATPLLFDINNEEERKLKVNEWYNELKSNSFNYNVGGVTVDITTLEKALLLINDVKFNSGNAEIDAKNAREARNMLAAISSHNCLFKNKPVFFYNYIADSKDAKLVEEAEKLSRKCVIEITKQKGYDGKRISHIDETELTEEFKKAKHDLLNFQNVIVNDNGFKTAKNGSRYIVSLISKDANSAFLEEADYIERLDKNGQIGNYYNVYYEYTCIENGEEKTLTYIPLYKGDKLSFVINGLEESKKYSIEQLEKIGAKKMGVLESIEKAYDAAWSEILSCEEKQQTNQEEEINSNNYNDTRSFLKTLNKTHRF